MTRRPLLLFMLASLAVGLVLMLLFEATLTRIVGVTALFAFIVSGRVPDRRPRLPRRRRGLSGAAA